ncbi:hypothetical protein [Teredinibacter turnerae]|uniref:hypothetical protein n=1 Tax=Teredinibacter turnerae TaxID=2426 RepID=UPI0004121D3A|nr:hypothetical protein [Teredinibacter turnerae]
MKNFLSHKRLLQCAAGVLASLGVATASAATNIIYIIDTTGSTQPLIDDWKAEITSAETLNELTAVYPGARFGLASHLDFPMNGHAAAGEYAYKLEQQLTTNTAVFSAAVNGLVSGYGGDTPESQLEAIYQACSGAGYDLNNNGSYLDNGDIPPSNMGFVKPLPATEMTLIFHFTSPLVYHNYPEDLSYPDPGVVNRPATLAEVVDTIENECNTRFFTFVPANEPLPGMLASTFGFAAMPFSYDMQTGDALNYSLMAVGSSASENPAEILAEATDGDIKYVGPNLEDLDVAIREVMRAAADPESPCEAGEKLIILPFGSYCVPI